jgi:hypothetical protein
MALLFFGIGDKPAIVLIFLAATWPLLINTSSACAAPSDHDQAARRTRQRAPHLSRHHPSECDAGGVHWAASLSAPVAHMVTAEMIAVKSGLGCMILNAQLTFRGELIVAGDAGYRSLCRQESASVAKNAHLRLGPRQTLYGVFIVKRFRRA